MTRFQPLFRVLSGPVRGRGLFSAAPLLAAGLLGLLAACASSGSEGSGSQLLVTLHNFKTGERFELASESHTDRVAYYSDKRNDAARKVQTDEIMSAFVAELGRQGLDDHAQPGRAPSATGSDVIRWGLEVEKAEQRRHWLVGTGSAPADWQQFQKCRDAFLQLYNITVSYQAVENDSGKQFLEDKARAAAGKK